MPDLDQSIKATDGCRMVLKGHGFIRAAKALLRSGLQALRDGFALSTAGTE
jgi:hypothetical protein